MDCHAQKITKHNCPQWLLDITSTSSVVASERLSNTYMSYILRTRGVFCVLPYWLALQSFLHAVSETFVQKPVQNGIYGTVSMSKPQCKRQQSGILIVHIDIQTKGANVVWQPAEHEHSNQGNQHPGHPLSTQHHSGTTVRSLTMKLI